MPLSANALNSWFSVSGGISLTNNIALRYDGDRIFQVKRKTVVQKGRMSRYVYFRSRRRAAYAETFRRFPQSCILHQRRVPFLLVS